MPDGEDLVPTVGAILNNAFMEDSDFRNTLQGLNLQLVKIAHSSNDVLMKFGLQLSFNSHVISSYHATRAIELLHAEILAQFPKSPDLLFGLMHSFALEAVFGLWRARQLFKQAPVVRLLGERAEKVADVFSSTFPFLKEARDALAHDDERVFGIVKGKELGGGQEHRQWISLRGTKLGCKNANLKDIEFHFPTASYFDLVCKLKEILT